MRESVPNPRPEPPRGARDCVLLVLDSCRFDSFVAAKPTNMQRLGPVQHRYSYASWTSPSHFNLLMGLLPHPSPRHVYASEHYQRDLTLWQQRLGVDDVGFLDMLPQLWLPSHLRDNLGYQTRAMVSLPVLNPATPINTGFDSYVKMDRHNDLAGMLDALEFSADSGFSEDRPTFWLLNAGETHYPYAHPDEPESDWPRVHGVHGVFKHLSQGRALPAKMFDQGRLDRLRARQVDAVRYVDGLIERLFDVVPTGTWITITSDHGELFGEGGYFGHGPILHDKVLEVPLVEGCLR